MKQPNWLVILVALLAAVGLTVDVPSIAQQTTGTPGSPSATMTIDGKQLPPPDQKFGGMIKAFKLGAPPHGGIAPGVDRIVMLLAHEENIREVVAFPMNQRAEDLMMNAPSKVSERQLRELHLKVVIPGADQKPKPSEKPVQPGPQA